MRYKAIIWDLGNVLVDWKPEYLFRKLISDPEKRKFFLQNICTNDWNENQDAGYPIQKATEEMVEKYPEWKEYIEAYYTRWTEMFSGPIEGTVEIFRKLREQTPLRHYALTNWSGELFPIALKLFPFFHWFDGRVVSGEEKMRKPTNEFYHLLLSRYQLAADEVLFIDDNERNIKAAEALGIRSIRFHNPEQLENDLREEGLLN
jgi:2-haloacid dehalogenase